MVGNCLDSSVVARVVLGSPLRYVEKSKLLRNLGLSQYLSFYVQSRIFFTLTASDEGKHAV